MYEFIRIKKQVVQYYSFVNKLIVIYCAVENGIFSRKIRPIEG